jgi:hypothetical protein
MIPVAMRTSAFATARLIKSGSAATCSSSTSPSSKTLDGLGRAASLTMTITLSPGCRVTQASFTKRRSECHPMRSHQVCNGFNNLRRREKQGNLERGEMFLPEDTAVGKFDNHEPTSPRPVCRPDLSHRPRRIVKGRYRSTTAMRQVSADRSPAPSSVAETAV